MSLANDVEQIPNLSPSPNAHPPICGIPAYAIGVICLILVVIGWVSTNFLTQHILAAYNKPFLMTWLNVVTFQIYFVFLLTGDPLSLYLRRSQVTNDTAQEASGAEEPETSPKSPKDVESQAQTQVPSPSALPFSPCETAKLAILFSILYVASNYTTTIAFGTTSAGSASILASTCGLFCLLLGAIMGVESVSLLKVVAVMISVGGVLVLGRFEFTAVDNRLLGNLMALLGAALYGVYSVYLKRVDESRLSSTLLFGWTGLYCMLGCWPCLLILHYTGVETLQLPPNGLCYLHIAINMFLGALIPNYLWNVAFALTSPLVVAIGIAFNIPLTLLAEYLLHGMVPRLYKIMSAVCILVGFSIVNVATIRPRWDHVFCKSRH